MLEVFIKPNSIELKQLKFEIPAVQLIQLNRNDYFLSQAETKDKPKKNTQTIEIPEGYILSPKD